jgi:xanthine dehydrogenase iron-sulfur cluster and FAD-binding subunit A
VYRAASSQLLEACRRGCSPVYATRNETSVLPKTYAVPDDVLSQHESDIDAAGGLDAVVDQVRAYRRIRQVIAESAGPELLEVLLGEDTLRALAGRLNVPLAHVRARKVAALAAIRGDQSIRQYVKEYSN